MFSEFKFSLELSATHVAGKWRVPGMLPCMCNKVRRLAEPLVTNCTAMGLLSWKKRCNVLNNGFLKKRLFYWCIDNGFNIFSVYELTTKIIEL